MKYQHIELLNPLTAIPERYLNSEKPPSEIMQSVMEYCDKSCFVAYPTIGATDEQKIEMEINTIRLHKLHDEIIATGYSGIFCMEAYGYIVTINIVPKEANRNDQIRITWNHLI